MDKSRWRAYGYVIKYQFETMTKRKTTDPALGFADHDHDGCRASCLRTAEEVCADAGLRLTPSRRRVLEILLESHTSMGAYDILARLAEDGQRAQPPVVYRALDFLTQNGLAHRIERLNAFVACARPGAAHDPAFMICRKCSAVAETQAAGGGDRLQKQAKAAGFRIERTVMEAEGICPKCQAQPT